MKYPITHKDCGAQVAWWTGPPPVPDSFVFFGVHWERMDGSHPKSGSMWNEVCPSCKKPVFMKDLRFKVE